MKRTAAACALALMCFAVLAGAAFGGKGGTPGPPSQPGHSGSPPGQQKKAEPTAPAQTPAANSTHAAKPTQHGERPAPKPKRKPKSPSPSSHAKAGKMTICHRTGSETNPFVQITVSANAWKAHQKHGDLNPVPAGGCPTGRRPGVGGGGGGAHHEKVTICHRTGSETNPFVVITISAKAWPAHQRHGDLNPVPAGGCPGVGEQGGAGGGGHEKITICHRTGSETNPFVVIRISENAWSAHAAHSDIRPVPAGGCTSQPAATKTASAVTTTAAPASTPPTTSAPVVASAPAATAQGAGTSTPSSQAAGRKGSRAARDEREAEVGVLGAARNLGAAVRRQSLPFTGLALWIPVLAGAGVAGAGFGLRRRTRSATNA
jgi:hypothetical protein